jgi:2-methylcitrate dehydratase PrpD
MTSTAGSTRAVAEYALGVDAAALPEHVTRQARVVLADTLGVLLAASRHGAVATALKAFPLTQGPGRATVVGHGKRATPEQAAFVNGCGGHDLELDDTHASSRTHAAAVIVPAALAAADIATDVTGADLLASLVAAYDVQCRVSKAMGVQNLFDNNFHPTSVIGTIGASVAAGRILRLSPEQMTYAIGLAGSQSSGTMGIHEDSSHMAKSFQTGIAARNGVYAALLAREGFCAMPDILTGDHDFLATYGGPTTYPEQLTLELGERYEILATSIKRHSSCGMTHSSVDALISILTEEGVAFDEIASIDVQLPHNAVTVIDNHPLWTHNIQYVMALVAHEGWIGPAHFTDEWTTNPEVIGLKERVTLRGNDELSAFPAKKGAIVAVETSRGTFTRTLDAPIGSPEHPLTDAALRDKFYGLAGTVLDAGTTDALWLLLGKLEAQSSCAELLAILTGE